MLLSSILRITDDWDEVILYPSTFFPCPLIGKTWSVKQPKLESTALPQPFPHMEIYVER